MNKMNPEPESPTGSLALERRFDAAISRVWETLRDPKLLKQWIAAPCDQFSDEPPVVEFWVGGRSSCR